MSAIDSTGRYIKIFDPKTSSCVYSFKRGLKICAISNSTFDPTGLYFAMSSNTDTVHVFSILPTNSQIASDNNFMSTGIKLFNNFRSYLPYSFSSSKSVVKLHLSSFECKWTTKESSLKGPTICFSADGTRLVLDSVIHSMQ